MKIETELLRPNEDAVDYCRLSARLRTCLELKLKELDHKGQLDHYFRSSCPGPDISGEDFLQAITGTRFNNEDFAVRACAGIRIWFGMRSCDRGAVLKRLFSYRSEAYFKSARKDTSQESYLFVRILIMELTPILSLREWEPLEDYHQHGFSDFCFLIESENK